MYFQMMIHSLVIVPAPAQRRWFWPSATWCQESWQRFEVRVPFVMLKNNVVLIVPCFEHHQSESTCCCLVTIDIRPKHFCVLPHSSSVWSWLASPQKKRHLTLQCPQNSANTSFLSKEHVMKIMKSWSVRHFQDFLARIYRENHLIQSRKSFDPNRFLGT